MNVLARYLIESFFPLEQAAEFIAGEQSSGTFVPVPGETDELKQKFRARVVSLQELSPLNRRPLPGAIDPSGDERLHAGEAIIAWPLHNFGPSIPNLLAAVAGNLFELRELAGIKLLDLELPPEFAERYPAPKFGVEGTRRLMGVEKGIMVGTIVKPSIGLTPEQLRPIVRELVEAEIDFIKDDELMANPPYSPLAERARVVMEEIERGAQRTGKRTMYAFNITGDLDELRRNYETIVSAGANCAMVCINLVGFAGLNYVRSFSEVPIHGHRTMIGALMRHPALGIDFKAYQKLARLCGADQLHCGGMKNKFYETDEQIRQSIEAVRHPLFGGYSCLPVLASAQNVTTMHVTWQRLRTDDLLVVAGGGIHAHPGGRAAGVRSLRSAWKAAVAGVPLEEAARNDPDIAQALDRFAAV
ncbi:MAG: ribulose-bisphosphate carboxylase large subunit family protein [Candidatus Eremiobacteraeota bacterium]|nr:ribulose-bisphosphate carboxylase large subunit family protein [Candidatus Eremiobacteraeota bacterium]